MAIHRSSPFIPSSPGLLSAFPFTRPTARALLLGGALALLPAAQATLEASPAAIDPTFESGSGADSIIFSLELIPDNRILIAGNFSQYAGTDARHLAMLDENGMKVGSETFDPDEPSGFVSQLSVAKTDASGRIVIGGNFSQVGEESRNNIARLVGSGGVDTGFDPGTGANVRVTDIAFFENNSMVIVGWFTQFDGDTANRIARLNENGSLAPGFNSGNGFNDDAQTVVIDDNGNILVGGVFTEYDTEPVGRLVRLGPNGELDQAFNSALGEGFDNIVDTILLLDDGHILVGGNFTEFNGEPAGRLVKLDGNGNRVDEGTFDIGEGFDGRVRALAVESSGRILAGGNFQDFDGSPVVRIARLNQDGSRDTGFNPGGGANGLVRNIAVRDDGKILIAGEFTSYDGESHGRIARLNGGDPDDTPITGYHLWADDRFGPDAPEAVRGPLADPDRDGIVNLLEYAFNGNPHTPDQDILPFIDRVASNGDEHLRITFTRIDAEDLIYRVQASNDMDEWDDIWSSEDNPFGSATEEVIDTGHTLAPGSFRFLRVVVTLVE